MTQLSGDFLISERQSQGFTVFSGDYNPLHVDPVYARRLQFGRTVIHGVHHLLRACDEVVSQINGLNCLEIKRLNATFPNPASIGQKIKYEATLTDEDETGVIEVLAYCNEKTILSLRLHFIKAAQSEPGNEVQNGLPPQEEPILQDFPPRHSQGVCDLFLDRALYADLFPNLTTVFVPLQMAQIIACTRIVGMKCPGMHSIFSRINLDFTVDNYISKTIQYDEEYKDKRVKIIKIGVKSFAMQGVLDTFFRPIPVAQPNYKEIALRVLADEFSDHRALVIGGSRGVGETTAKILAAGGAKVAITYNNGLLEAQKVKDDINSSSGRGACQIIKLDACNILKQPAFYFENKYLPTHIYFFASPFIQANRSPYWNSELYQNFCRFYVQACHEIITLYAKAAKKEEFSFFYPSTIYIEEPENGFTEYAVAKAAGEALGKQLQRQYANMRFFAPRLIRMATDQTTSIIPVKSESTFDVMYKVLKVER